MKPYHTRCAEGKIRNEEWRSLSAKEQLADLDRRLGVGVGAARQRARLAKLIEEQNNPVIVGAKSKKKAA